MKARVSAVVAVIVAVFAWSAPARAAEPNWPDSLILATASPGGTYHAYGAGLARMLTRVLQRGACVDGPWSTRALA